MQGILYSDLRDHVIRPVLQRAKLWTTAAETLLLGTAAHESRMGYYLKQYQGPALGIYQIEPATHHDLWVNFLSYRKELSNKADEQAVSGDYIEHRQPREQELITNLAYSTIIARLIYYRTPEPLPAANDLEAIAYYWKQHYNTFLGKGRVEDFIAHYQQHVLEG